MWKKTLLVMGISLFVTILTPSIFAQLQMANEIQVPDVVITQGNNIIMPINLTSTTNGPIQTIMFNVEYNSSVIELSSIEPGDLTPVSNGWQHILGDNNRSITIATITKENAIANGSTGSLVLLNFSVVGQKGDFSYVNISGLDISNTALQHGTATIKNGTFRIDAPPSTPSKPSGFSSGYADQSYSYSTSATDPDGDKIKYYFNWGDGTGSWTDYVNSGQSVSKSHSWHSQGTYNIKVKAQDEYGAESDWSTAKIVTITVYIPPPTNQHPTVAITSPSDSTTVSGTISIQGTSYDSDGTVQSVQVKIDSGSWITVTGTTSWSYSWDTATVANGSHTIYVRSYDGTDYSNISSVTVTVDNIPPNHKPIVDIIFPTDGISVKKTFTIHGTASDVDGNETIQKVEIKIDDGNWIVVDGTASWNYTWDSTSVDNRNYVIQARAYDGQEYSSIDSIIVKVNNEKGGGGIPGFEMVAMIVALGAVLLLKRRYV